jgi:hypothetical protein
MANFFPSLRAQIKDGQRVRRAARLLNQRSNYPTELPNPDARPLDAKRLEELDQIQTLGIFLGPYRNLTSLIAAVLFLHPHSQVLNHAGPRLLDRREYDFLRQHNADRFSQFMHEALRISEGGARGTYGGSILLAHSFADHPRMQSIYRKRYAWATRKYQIDSLIWKESQMVTQILRANENRIHELVRQNRKLRFILPIRNPIDCANSLQRLKMSRIYGEQTSGSLESIIDLILDDFKWFLELENRYPEQFFHFFQNSFDAEMLEQLETFLKLPHDEQWVQDALSIYRLRKPYQHEEQIVAHYENRIEALFGRGTALYSKFLSLNVATAEETGA